MRDLLGHNEEILKKTYMDLSDFRRLAWYIVLNVEVHISGQYQFIYPNRGCIIGAICLKDKASRVFE
jgi:hypothetical protein